MRIPPGARVSAALACLSVILALAAGGWMAGGHATTPGGADSVRVPAPEGPARAPAGVLLVVNTADDALAFVDPVALRVDSTITVGEGPRALAVSADGRFAYVSNYGSPEEEPGRTISVVDIPARRVISTILLDGYLSPCGLALARDARRLYATIESRQAVLEIDDEDGRISRVFATLQQRSHAVVLAADEGRLYVANAGSASLSVIRLQTGSVSRVAVGMDPEGLALSPDGRFLWVANRADGTVMVLDTGTDQVVDTLATGKGPLGVAFTPDGRRALVSNSLGNDVTVFDVGARKLVARIATGELPAGLLVEPDGRYAWVAQMRRDRLTRIDLATLKEAGHVIPGRAPAELGWARVAR
jgi:YVTN family beta-propeller protein